MILFHLAEEKCPYCHRPWLFNASNDDLFALRMMSHRFRSLVNDFILSRITLPQPRLCWTPNSCAYYAELRHWRRLRKIPGLLVKKPTVLQVVQRHLIQTGRHLQGEGPSNY